MDKYIYPADILLPDFGKCDAEKWATIACDQFTSQPDYWKKVIDTVGDAPSTLRMMLPEIWLGNANQLTPIINDNMNHYRSELLKSYPQSMVYLSRTMANGQVRHGIVAMIDLEQYDYKPGSAALIRATEGTVLERIPPRVNIRRDASLEMPHIMLLIDDRDKTVIEPLEELTADAEVAYDTDLMLGGGHITGKFISEELQDRLNEALGVLASPEVQTAKYGNCENPFLFAVGDGNHSLAAAKTLYEEIKEQYGYLAYTHPARFALCEIVNLHDPAIKFEPIYRIMFSVDRSDAVMSFYDYTKSVKGNGGMQSVKLITAEDEISIIIPHSFSDFPVATVQTFIDGYIKKHPNVTADFIHGKDTLKQLMDENTLGFTFSGISKNRIFGAIIEKGVLPKKTFSIGEACDKRYYMEARALRNY